MNDRIDFPAKGYTAFTQTRNETKTETMPQPKTELDTFQARKEKEKELEATFRKLYRLKDRDTIKVFSVPKGKKTKNMGSFSYKQVTQKAQNLKTKVARLERQLADVQYSSLTREEKQYEMRKLRCKLRYTNQKLSRELENSPRHNVVVVEDE